MKDDEVRRRSLETLGKMGIPPTRFNQYPHEFSGGMRQRIMIALALVLRPKLLIADEPTTSLDVIVEAQILRILADLRRNFGTALLLITHNLGIVAEACDRVAVMYAGQIVEEGDARDVFSDPAHPYTRSFCAPRSHWTRQSSTRSRARRRTSSRRPRDVDSTLGARTRCGCAPRVSAGRPQRRTPRLLLAAHDRRARWARDREPLERDELPVAEEA
jgi:peptide/nickel transport system ATP-binding protein